MQISKFLRRCVLENERMISEVQVRIWKKGCKRQVTHNALKMEKLKNGVNEKYVIYLHTSNSKAKIFSSLHGVAMFKII